MKRVFIVVTFFLLVLFPGLCVSAGELVDRIVATVNKSVVLQSDLNDAIRYEWFLENKPLANVTRADVEAVLNRVVDQELLRQQMDRFTVAMPTTEEVKHRVEELRKSYPGGETDQGWQEVLHRYSLTQAEVDSRLAEQLGMLNFIGYRLRPNVKVQPEEVEAYYREKLLPELELATEDEGNKPPTEMAAQIEEVLTEQKVSELLSNWLRTLRSQGEVHVQTDRWTGEANLFQEQESKGGANQSN